MWHTESDIHNGAMNLLAHRRKQEAMTLEIMANITIAAGTITAEAEAFLSGHGATIERISGLSLVTLPEGVEIAYPPAGSGLDHAIDWNGDIESPWVAIDLNIDAYSTRIHLKQ